MQITLITRLGGVANIKPIKNRTPLGADELLRIEIEGAAGLSRILDDDLLGLFSKGVAHLVLVNYPDSILASEFPVIVPAGRAAYVRIGAHDDFLRTLRRCEEFKYGEFCVFSSRLGPSDLQEALVRMDRVDTISVLANRALQITALMGLDVESDTCILASMDEALVARVIEAALSLA